MDSDKLNKVVFYILVISAGILALLIGISVYWRAPVEPPASTLLPTPTPFPTTLPPPITYYISGQAYNSATKQPIANTQIAWVGQQTATTDALGNFTLSSQTSSGQAMLVMPDYATSTIPIGFSAGQIEANIGKVDFSWYIPTPFYGDEVVFLKKDSDNVSRLYSVPLSGGNPRKLLNDTVLSFSQSPDLQHIAYVTKNSVDKTLRAGDAPLSNPKSLEGSVYSKYAKDAAVSFSVWSSNSCCVAWASSHTNGTRLEGNIFQYANVSGRTMGFVPNPLTGADAYEGVVKAVVSPNGSELAGEYMYKDSADGKLYHALMLLNLKTNVETGVFQGNAVAQLVDFFFDAQGNLQYHTRLQTPSSDQWTKFNPITGESENYFNQPEYWNSYLKAVVSPDYQKIVFPCAEDLCYSDASGLQSASIHASSKVDVATINNLIWVKDASRIAFTAKGPDGKTGVWLYNFSNQSFGLLTSF